MILLDLEGRIRYSNLAYAEMLDYTAAELAERNLVSLMYADDGEEMAAVLGQLQRGEVESVRVEKRSLSRGGSVLWLCFSFSLLRRTTGEPHALIARIEDCTRQQVADDARMELHREREALLDTASEGIYGVDLQGRCTFVNRSAAKLLGYTPEEMLGRNLQTLIDASAGDSSAAAAAVERRDAEQDGQQVHTSVETLRRKDGSPVPVEQSAEAVVVDGEVRGTVVTLRPAGEQDCDALLEQERLLREQTEQLTSAVQAKERVLRDVRAEQLQLLEAIPQMVWVTGPGGEPEYVNEHWRTFTGASMGEEIGEWQSLIHPEDREWTAQQFEASIRTRRTYEVEHRMRMGDGGYRWVLARAQPLIAADGTVTHWFGTSTDIHERKSAEDLLRRTEKLAAAGRLAATVAHEINNPLEAVGNLLFLALNEHAVPPGAMRYLQMANEELRRVGHIVSQTLGFYRESNVRQPIDLGMLVNDVLSLYQRKLDARQIRVTRQMESGAVVDGIAGELRQVLANLLANALDAMEPNGVLGVAVEAAQQEARITISDTGHGIAPALLGHIFEPFFTTKEDAGTGLGLWVSKGIAEKHDGRLEVASSQGREDHGTAFVLTLPRRTALPLTA
jgi:PAS domain S-box-containing protein